MSLSYHSEHLAWQQRVGQERSRATNFYKTAGNFFPASTCKSQEPFPKSNQDLVPNNYKSFNYNLAYTFGGTKHIRNAGYESPSKRVEKLREEVRNFGAGETPEKVRKISKGYVRKYVEDLKQKISEEKSKRTQLEKRLKLVR